jgi:RNase P subunit RPR2
MTITKTWTYGYCESCSKNSHEKIKTVRERIVSGDPEGKYSEETWVCPQCGSTKRL